MQRLEAELTALRTHRSDVDALERELGVAAGGSIIFDQVFRQQQDEDADVSRALTQA
jgi:hypothetical protein